MEPFTGIGIGVVIVLCVVGIITICYLCAVALDSLT